MKKLISSLIIALIVLLILWAILGWYFGLKAEKEFKALLEESSQLAGKRFVRAELLSYKRIASGAKARLGLSSDYPTLDERIGDLELHVKLLNGPVFFNKTGVSIGGSRWVLTVVDVASTTVAGEIGDKRQAYQEIFPKGFPSAVIRVGFEEKAHYVAKFGVSFADVLMTGIFDFKTQNNRGAITVKNFVLGSLPNRISANEIQISYQHQKALTTRYKPGTASLQTSALKIQYSQFKQPLVFAVKANSKLSLAGNTLKGYIKADIRNRNNVGDTGGDFPIDKADISLQFDGLPADVLIAFSEANDDLDNLHQQAQWVLEELGEVPEGQDQLWRLYDRIEESSKALPNILAKQIGDTGFIKLKVTTHYNGVSSFLDGNLKLQRDHLKISSWLSLLDGEAQVDLDEYLFSDMKKFFPIMKSSIGPKFKLLLKDSRVLMAR